MSLKIGYWALWFGTIGTLAFTHTGPWWQFAIIVLLVELLLVVRGWVVLSEFKVKLYSLRDWSMALIKAQEERITELERALRKD